jgi:hypothetical protein
MTKKQLFDDLDRLREKYHYIGHGAERIVKGVIEEARYWASHINPDRITDKELEDYLEQDPVVKKYLDQCRMSMGELIDSLGLRD